MGNTLPFVMTFVDERDSALRTIEPSGGLTPHHKEWLGLCVQGILVTNSVCWKRFDRASLGRRSHAVLFWRVRQQPQFGTHLLRASLAGLLWRYGITTGVLVVDDSAPPRSKHTTRIDKAPTLKDTRSGGTINGQNVVVFLLVPPLVTVPIGVEFSMPDPALTAWYKQERELTARGVPKAERPAKPQPHPPSPTQQTLALRLLEQFRQAFPHFKMACLLADPLYGTPTFLDAASALFGGIQVIRQLRRNQKVRDNPQAWDVASPFQKFPGVPQRIRIRGGRSRAYRSAVRGWTWWRRRVHDL